MEIERLTEDEIRAKLEAIDRTPPDDNAFFNLFNRPRRRAGVLIPLTIIGGVWNLLFIRRSEFEDDHHGGQVAFPGGGAEEGDGDIIATALRETREETGLQVEDVRVLGALNDIISITNYLVTPVVGAFDWPYPLEPDEAEVARIFTIPLTFLADPANVRTEYHQSPERGSWPVIYFEKFDGELLWGFTAGLTRQLIEVLGS